MYITLIQYNGLESNEKFFEKKLSEKTFLKNKNSIKKNKFKQKFFSKVPKFGYFPKVV